MTTTPDLTLFSLAGKTILVAGASKGIGQAIAAGLAKAGANVIGFGRSPVALASPGFSYQCCDMRQRDQFDRLVAQAVQAYGAVDAYFHVAGITVPSQDGLQDIVVFEQTLNANLYSAYACCATVGRQMQGQQRGSIVTVTSIGSLLGFPNNPAYVASKGGLRMMSKALALDLGKSNVRVNCLVPGYVHTDMTHASYADPGKSKERVDRTMLGRWGQVSDLVGAAVFLASDASTYVTGTDLVVDGGWTAKGL
jgi:NAD(P)-dependent dehydrogenase (short-subunit alcohol dehydrogenase family)